VGRARNTVESPRLQSTQGLIDIAIISILLTITIVGGY
jgi:hypothetical protein